MSPRCRVVVSSLLITLAANAAVAKPLPKGLTVSLVKGKVMATRDGASVPVVRHGYPIDKVVKAELSDDGRTLLVTIAACEGMFGDGEGPEQIPLAEVDAAIENVLGMKLQLKKKYADAIPHFQLAAQGAPTVPVYTTNLLSAQSMAGKLDDADKVIGAAAKTMAPWIAWRLAVDSDLKALKARPGAKLDAPKKGTAKGNLAGKLAYSPLGFVATEVFASVYDGIPDGSSDYELVINSIATGKEVLRLPTEHTCADPEAMEAMGGPVDKGCAKREAAKTASKRKVTDALLAQLGFDVVKGGYSDAKDATSFKAPDGRTLEVKDDKATLTVGGKATEIPWEHFVWESGWTPGAFVVIERSKTPMSCAGDGEYKFSLGVIPTP